MDAADVLRQHGISVTYQRMKVLQALIDRRDHPSAEDIHLALQGCKPPIGKATVYNTLRLLLDKGIVKPLYIDPDGLRYDIELDGHGHFHCERCGRIYNFEAAVDSAELPGLEGFQVRQRDLYVRGICPKCQEQAADAAHNT